MSNNKSWVEIVLMPLVVALVGIGGASILSFAQLESAKHAHRTQIESDERNSSADRQVAVMSIFSDKITSDSESERILALRLLEVVDGELASDLARVVSEDEGELTTVKNVAIEVAKNAEERGYWFAVIGSFKSRNDAEEFVDNVSERVAEYNLKIYYAENDYYGVTLDGYLSKTAAIKRVEYAISSGIAKDAYLWSSRVWGENIR